MIDLDHEATAVTDLYNGATKSAFSLLVLLFCHRHDVIDLRCGKRAKEPLCFNGAFGVGAGAQVIGCAV
jgi:hypothetical protein